MAQLADLNAVTEDPRFTSLDKRGKITIYNRYKKQLTEDEGFKALNPQKQDQAQWASAQALGVSDVIDPERHLQDVAAQQVRGERRVSQAKAEGELLEAVGPEETTKFVRRQKDRVPFFETVESEDLSLDEIMDTAKDYDNINSFGHIESLIKLQADKKKVVRNREFAEQLANQYYGSYINMSPKERIVKMSVDRFDLFGAKSFLSRQLTEVDKVLGKGALHFEARKKAIQRIREESLPEDLALVGLSDVPQLATEFFLISGAMNKTLGALKAGAKWTTKALRTGGLFAAHTAVQLPEEGETFTDRAKGVGSSAVTGVALAGVGKLIPSWVVRAPIVVASFAAADYASTYQATKDHSQARRAALKTASTVLAFEVSQGLPEYVRGRRRIKLAQKILKDANDPKAMQRNLRSDLLVEQKLELSKRMAAIDKLETAAEKIEKRFPRKTLPREKKGAVLDLPKAEQKAGAVVQTGIEEPATRLTRFGPIVESNLQAQTRTRQISKALQSKYVELRQVERDLMATNAQLVKGEGGAKAKSLTEDSFTLQSNKRKILGDITRLEKGLPPDQKLPSEASITQYRGVIRGVPELDVARARAPLSEGKVAAETVPILKPKVGPEKPGIIRTGVEKAPSKSEQTPLTQAKTNQKVEFGPTSDFKPKSFRSQKIDGAKVTVGLRLDTGEKAFRSVTFPKEWTQTQRASWLKNHKQVAQAVEVLKETSKDLAEASKPEVEKVSVEAEKVVRQDQGLIGKIKSKLSPLLRVTEPAAIIDNKFGELVNAEINAAINNPKAITEKMFELETMKVPGKGVRGLLEKAKVLKQRAVSLTKLQRELRRLPRKTQENMFDAIGPGLSESAEGKEINRKARASLTKRQLFIVDEGLQPIRDKLFEEALKVDPKLNKVDSYFHGLFKNASTNIKRLQALESSKKTSKSFTERKYYRTPADAKAAGFERVDVEPIENLRRVSEIIQHTRMIEGLASWMKKNGLNSVIKEASSLTKEESNSGQWKEIGKGQFSEPAFEGFVVDVDVARVLNNRLSSNLFSTTKGLRVLRGVTQTAQTIKLLIPLFHARSMFNVYVADSGFGGFLKPTTWGKVLKVQRGLTKNQFEHPLWDRYAQAKGARVSSLTSSTIQAVDRLVESAGKGVGRVVTPFRVGVRTATAPHRWLNRQLFEKIIPRMQFEKFVREVTIKEKKLGKHLNKAQDLEIVREAQNLYGLMNEGIMGRSPTLVSLMRVPFLAPGFFEGQVRTIGKATGQLGTTFWKGREGRKGGRSALNVWQSWAVLMGTSTVIRALWEGEVPEFPTTREELRDYPKIRTGAVDDKGREVMLDLAQAEKDYWDFVIEPLFVAADGKIKEIPEAMVGKMLRRAQGMAAPVGKVMADMADVYSGKGLMDWKREKVIRIGDPLLVKVNKVIRHEWDNFKPIPMSSIERIKKVKGISGGESFVAAVMGLRVTLSTEELELNSLARTVWDMKEEQESLYRRLGKEDHPRKAVKNYNEIVDNMMSDSAVSKDIKKKTGLTKRDLLVDPKRLLANKAFQLSTRSLESHKVRRGKSYLENFGVKNFEQAKRLLLEYRRKHPRMTNDTFIKRLLVLRSRY